MILAIGCLEASPTEEECVGLVEVRVLGIHWHDEVFGKTLLAVLALKFSERCSRWQSGSNSEGIWKSWSWMECSSACTRWR